MQKSKKEEHYLSSAPLVRVLRFERKGIGRKRRFPSALGLTAAYAASRGLEFANIIRTMKKEEYHLSSTPLVRVLRFELKAS